jgi:hypothetical protein
VTGIGLVVLAANHGVTGIGLVVMAALVCVATIPKPIAAVRIDSASTAATIHLFMTSLRDTNSIPGEVYEQCSAIKREKRHPCVERVHTLPSPGEQAVLDSVVLSRVGRVKGAVNGTEVLLMCTDSAHRSGIFACVLGPIRILDRNGLHPYHP